MLDFRSELSFLAAQIILSLGLFLLFFVQTYKILRKIFVDLLDSKFCSGAKHALTKRDSRFQLSRCGGDLRLLVLTLPTCRRAPSVTRVKVVGGVLVPDTDAMPFAAVAR
jgi:hypothetical protein